MTKSKYVVLLVSFLFAVSMFGCSSQTPAATDPSTPPTQDSSSTTPPAPPEILPPEQLPESGTYEEVFGINFDDVDSVLVTSGRSGKTAELTDPQLSLIHI